MTKKIGFFQRKNKKEINALSPNEVVEVLEPNFEKEDLKFEMPDKPIVVLTNEVYNKLMTYTKSLDVEISGLGIVKRKDNIFQVEEIFLLNQTVSTSECDIEPKSQVGLMQKLIAEGKSPSDIKLWWHSHHTYGTFWSPRDEETMTKYGGKDFLISIVTTHSGKMKARLQIFNPIKAYIENVSIMIQRPTFGHKIIADCQKEIQEKVKIKDFYQEKSPIYQSQYHGYGNYGGYKNYQYEHPNAYEKTKKKKSTKEFLEEVGLEENFVDGNIRWIFNEQSKTFDAFNTKTNKQLTRQEISKMGETDYNEFYALDSRSHQDGEENLKDFPID